MTPAESWAVLLSTLPAAWLATVAIQAASAWLSKRPLIVRINAWAERTYGDQTKRNDPVRLDSYRVVAHPDSNQK